MFPDFLIIDFDSTFISKESLDELMNDREFCEKNNLHSSSDVFRMSLNRTLREFEHNKFRREVSS